MPGKSKLTPIVKQSWPDTARYGDVRTCGKHNLTPVDWLVGGFPCQDISTSNTANPQGIDGSRSGLWREFARLICELHPRYVIVENVAALLRRGMGRVLADLAGLRYDAEWQVLRASAFGAPHERARVFLVAYPHEERWSARLRGDAPLEHGVYPLWQASNTLVDVWSRLAQLETRLGEPSVRGGYDGLSRQLECELAGYGDAVVPPVAQWVGECILAWEDAHASIERGVA